MKRAIATAAVCGASLFGLTAVAGAAGNPPNPSQSALDHAAKPCSVVLSSNPNVNGTVNFPANPVGIFDGGQVGAVFCGL